MSTGEAMVELSNGCTFTNPPDGRSTLFAVVELTDGSKFVNQSSLFAVFTSPSSCKATAQLLCVHADVTGLVRRQRCLFVWCSC